MRNFIKFVMISVMFMVIAMSCVCNRQTDKPLKYKLQDDVTITTIDSTMLTLDKGSVVYVNEVDNPVFYHLLTSKYMLDDNEDYKDVIVRMGKINDSTEVIGYMNVGTLKNHKRLR